ncbi:MAG: S8 family serine peptidase [Acidobacteriota bacterium]
MPSTRSSSRPGLADAFARPLCLALAGLLSLVPAQLDASQLTPQAAAQIAALVQEKQSRTAAQHKIDSRLLLELAQQRDSSMLEHLPKLEVARHANAEGAVLIDLDAGVDAALLARITELGGTVHSAFPRWRAVRATLPLTQIESLASLAQVRSLRPADVYMTQMINTTEGDVAHAADVARATFSVDGTGVSAGAMSDSVDALADLQGSGDLPAGVTVLPGQDGNPGTSEGTALLEIIHDMAPGADLFFATGRGGQAQMAQNILDLAAAGCTVIVDDVLYFTEPVFQDGIIAQAVDEVASQGVAYYSSAGNSGNLAAGTAGVWEGDYVGIGLPAPLAGLGVSAHDFGGGQNSNEVTQDTPFFFTLQWSDPSPGSDNDYDLYVLDAALANVIAASTSTQNGTQFPVEIIDSTTRDDLGNRIVVVQFGGSDRFLHVNSHRGELAEATDGQIFGHPAAEGAIAVAAVNVATAGGGAFTGGAANPAEPFTSDGPRRIFFEADGTPIGGASRGGQQSETREKPDITAADGVSTATPGFNPFFGTSAAAPHAAGIAALIKQILSSLDAIGMSQRVKRDALDIESTGIDNVSGSGIPLADNAIEGKMGFQGDDYSVNPALAENGSRDCKTPHKANMDDNTANFDGLNELIDPYTDGTQPFVFEFETDPDNLSEGGGRRFGDPENPLETTINMQSMNGEDLFPEGFEDPETGTPLDAACIEIGIDDALDGDCPTNVTSATVQFFNNSTPIFDEPLDITNAFSPNLFDGTANISVPNLAGQGINNVVVKMQLNNPPPSDIFADGFESGDATAWR